MGPSLLAGTLDALRLGDTRFLAAAYEAGSIAAIRYDMAALPEAESLASDLSRFTAMYARCVEANDQLAANSRIRTSSRSAERRTTTFTPALEFKPKDSTDYVAH